MNKPETFSTYKVYLSETQRCTYANIQLCNVKSFNRYHVMRKH